MMEELYNLHSTSSSDHHHHYSMHHQDMVAAPTSDHHHHHHPHLHYHGTFPSTFFPTPVGFGSEQQQSLFSGSSSVSDAASMVVAEMQAQRGGGCEEEVSSAIRAKIASHPLYPKLLGAYIDCQKVGAPPELAYMLDEIRQESDLRNRSTVVAPGSGPDPELDEFMKTYCDILIKYKSDLSRPFDEATTFLNDVQAKFTALCDGSSRNHSDDAIGSSDEDLSGGEFEMNDPSRTNEDRELKDKLLRKYSGYISTLKHEFSKKKKKGKLPKEARQTLLNWWQIHYKWPYPTEADKTALALSTGLDQKQINNWFINQRKRHWKPTENMQFAVVDNLYGPVFTNDS